MDIRLHFSDFWRGFDTEDNVWVWILKQNHNVVIDNINPNLVISMRLSRPFPNVYTIYMSNEPFFPVPNNYIADYFIGNFYLDYENYSRFPSYYMYLYWFLKAGVINDLSFFKEINRPIPEKTSFCSYISRSFNGKRGRFFEKLNAYKKVDTNVHPFNDISIPFDNSSFTSSLPKIEFIKKYKFNLAFENNYRGHHPSFPTATIINGELEDLNGMTTEKLIEPLVAGVIPIYWGNSKVGSEFNPNTFLNYYDYETEDDFINKIIELDNDDALYESYFKAPIVTPSQDDVLTLNYMVDIFDKILSKI